MHYSNLQDTGDITNILVPDTTNFGEDTENLSDSQQGMIAKFLVR